MASERIVMLYSKAFQPHEGWYRRAYNEAKSLVDSGRKVTLLAWDRAADRDAEEELDGIRVHRFGVPAGTNVGPRNLLKHLRFHRAVSRYLRATDFDVVHCFNVDTMIPGLAAARRRSAKAVVDLCEPEYYRGFWNGKYSFLLRGINLLEKRYTLRFDHVFVHNTFQVRKFERYGVRRLTQVGSYPNRSMLAAEAKTAEKSEVVVGRLGTMYANNGIEELIDAFQLLLPRAGRRTSAPRYRLRLAGHVFDDYRPTFERLIAPLGENVLVTGAYNVADLPRLYAEIDISVQLQGGGDFAHVTPTKLFEAMARGVPVVANAIGDVAEILTAGPCGVIVDERNPDSICDGIEKLAADAELRREFSQNGLRLARQHYTWEAVLPRFLDAYDAL